MRVRVLLGDDHAIVSEGLIRLLEPEFQVVSAVGDGRTLVSEAGRLRPDVVIFDIGMPLLNGIEAGAQIRTVLPTAKLVFLSQHSRKDYVQAAFHVGGCAYVLKNSAAAELVVAVREVLAGRHYVCSELQRRFPDVRLSGYESPSEMFGNDLTPRQREVLQLIAEGKSAKEIAFALGISVKTVEFHKASIMDELGIRTTAELTRYAIEQGILSA